MIGAFISCWVLAIMNLPEGQRSKGDRYFYIGLAALMTITFSYIVLAMIVPLINEWITSPEADSDEGLKGDEESLFSSFAGNWKTIAFMSAIFALFSFSKDNRD